MVNNNYCAVTERVIERVYTLMLSVVNIHGQLQCVCYKNAIIKIQAESTVVSKVI
jgi:hypothetical protein